MSAFRQTYYSKNARAYSYRKWGAEWLYYFSRKLYERGWHRIAYIFKFLNTFIFRAYIPPQAKIGVRLDLPHGGFGVVMNENTEIGDDAIILHNVTIANGGARIGNRVYIGAGAVIIGAVRIGDDVAIGANAVVNFNVPNGANVVAPKGTILGKDNMNESSTEVE